MTTKDYITKIIKELEEEYAIPHAVLFHWLRGFDTTMNMHTIKMWMDYPLNDYTHFHTWEFKGFTRDGGEQLAKDLKFLIEYEIVRVINEGAKRYGYETHELTE